MKSHNSYQLWKKENRKQTVIQIKMAIWMAMELAGGFLGGAMECSDMKGERANTNNCRKSRTKTYHLGNVLKHLHLHYNEKRS